jgi:hypothetical protein
MRKLKIIEHISLDGVIQHSADAGDFPYGEWTAPYWTPAGREAIIAAHGGSFDLLLGRRTYAIWSSIRSCWARVSASLRREPRHAHSSSSARNQCRPASSSVITTSPDL